MKRILIVENNVRMALMARCLIENADNPKCDSVSDSYQAIDALCDLTYDCIVLSHNAKGIRGLEILRQVDSFIGLDPILSEQDRIYRKTPVIIVCGKDFRLPSGIKFNHFQIVDCLNYDRLEKYASVIAS